jgi:hypothetical protein
VRLEGLGKLKNKSNNVVGNGTRDLPACSIMPRGLRPLSNVARVMLSMSLFNWHEVYGTFSCEHVFIYRIEYIISLLVMMTEKKLKTAKKIINQMCFVFYTLLLVY